MDCWATVYPVPSKPRLQSSHKITSTDGNHLRKNQFKNYFGKNWFCSMISKRSKPIEKIYLSKEVIKI